MKFFVPLSHLIYHLIYPSCVVLSIGIAVVIGGQYFGWNFSLAAGFGSCYIAMLMIGLAYLCLCLCNAGDTPFLLRYCLTSCLTSLSYRTLLLTTHTHTQLCFCLVGGCLCLLELTSSMPFAGGAYGLARVSLGLWPGNLSLLPFSLSS